MRVRSRVVCVGDDVDTDAIIPGKYLGSQEPAFLALHVLEGLSGRFPGDLSNVAILCAGENFGCGSSREHAALALRAAGIRCVIAASFARIFFRNAINTGLLAVELKEVSRLSEGDDVEVDIEYGKVVNHSTGEVFSIPQYAGTVRDIVAAGGLVEYVRRRTGR